MDSIWTTIGIGAIQGVASGVILAGLFWLWGRLHRRFERREQIRYIAALIKYWRKRILTADKLRLPGSPMPKEDSLIREDFRALFHKGFRIELDSALSQRCTRLTYDEVEQVREIFFRRHELNPDTSYRRDDHVTEFLEAESIKWLGLDPMNRDHISDN